MQIMACPKCKSVDNVTNKLLTLDIGKESYFLEDYVVSNQEKYKSSSFTREYFISALFCNTCELGFVPDSMLEELGIEKNYLKGRLGRNRPYGVGEIVADDAYDIDKSLQEMEHVWIFHAAAASFSGGVFSTRAKAEKWILQHRLSGILAQYPLDIGVYDWAIKHNHFEIKHEHHKSPKFIGRFRSIAQERLRFTDGHQGH